MPAARRSGSTVHQARRDGLGYCFRAVADAGCTHQPIRTRSGRKAVLTPAFNRRYDLAAMMPASVGLPFEPRQCATASSNCLRLMRNQKASLSVFQAAARRAR
jgi:hypothetical protein